MEHQIGELWPKLSSGCQFSVPGWGSQELEKDTCRLLWLPWFLPEAYFAGVDVTQFTELDFAGLTLPRRKAISKPDS